MAAPKITQIELVIFEHEIQDMGRDYNGFNLVYEKGSVLKSQPGIIRIHTSEGIVGEYMGGRAAVAGQMAGWQGATSASSGVAGRACSVSS